MKIFRTLFTGLGLVVALGGLALAQDFFTNGVPRASPPLAGTERFGADTGVVGRPAEAISTQLLANFVGAVTGSYSLIIGGEFGQNLWQRYTISPLIEATSLYVADRWFAWGGASSDLVIQQDNNSADFPPGSLFTNLLMSRTGTGTTQVCNAQVIDSFNASQLSAATIEVDYWAIPGAAFSGDNNNLQVYVITGTGFNEGSEAMAFGLNGSGGGASAWTGQANNEFDVQMLPSLQRYTVVTNVPAGTQEVGLAFCWVPNGAGSAGDSVSMNQIQLRSNPGAIPYTGLSSGTQALQFVWRDIVQEYALERAYFQEIFEPAANDPVGWMGVQTTTTKCDLTFTLPVGDMRVTPVMSFNGNALSATTWKVQAGTTSVLATPFLATTFNNFNSVGIEATRAVAGTLGQACTLVGAGGGNVVWFNAEL